MFYLVHGGVFAFLRRKENVRFLSLVKTTRISRIRYERREIVSEILESKNHLVTELSHFRCLFWTRLVCLGF